MNSYVAMHMPIELAKVGAARLHGSMSPLRGLDGRSVQLNGRCLRGLVEPDSAMNLFGYRT